MFCTACGSEYVAGIDKCTDCGAELVVALPRLDSTKDTEPLRMVYVADPTTGPMIEELLKNNRIESILQGEAEASILPASGGLTEVRVWVRASDRVRAGQLIEAFFETGSAAIEIE